MKIIKYFLFLCLYFTQLTIASANNDSSIVETKIVLHTKTGDIFGTLTTPQEFDKIPVAIIIAGSGPTDRDGNNPSVKNNSLKLLALGLCKNGIASLRYDKRGIAESKAAGKNEIDLRFDDYVNDAKEWLELLKQDKRFSQYIIIGHSEGSLIGMIAGTKADKYISIAGAGRPADLIIKEQLNKQPKGLKDLCYSIIDSLKNGKLVDSINPMLFSLFRPSIQPYMINWFSYDPQMEIKKLSIPVLIIQGTNDIQISIEDAHLLSNAYPKAQLVFIDSMNHIFKIIKGDKNENINSYNNPSLPIANELINNMTDFVFKK